MRQFGEALEPSVMVNFMYQLDWPKGCSDGKTLFLGVSVRVFLEEISM